MKQQSEIDAEYSPSFWSKRFSNSDDCLANHLKFVQNESEMVRSQVPYITLNYGSGPNETIDVYGIDLPNNSPIIVYVHGGYWQWLSKSVSAYPVLPLYKAGYRVAIVDYNLCPNVTLSELVSELCKAGNCIIQYAKEMTAKHISFVGHSAGAHLILCMLIDIMKSEMTNNLIKHLFLISGIYDLTELKMSIINENNLLSLSNENVANLSPIQFDYSVWRTFQFDINIYVAENDSKTFQQQSNDLYKRLHERYKLNSNFKLIPNCDHFDIVEQLVNVHFTITNDIIKNI